MNRNISILICLLGLSSICAHAQVILSPNERSGLLEGMQTVIENTSRPETSIAEDRSPFYMPERKTVAPVAGNDKTVEEVHPEVEALPTALSDSMALEVISRQFKPLGSMVLGNRGFLQLARGGTIEKGQNFNAEIRGNSYKVLIIEVTQDGYTLELGTARMSQSFNKTSEGQ